MYIYRSDLSLLRFYSGGCFIKVSVDRIICNPFMAHSSLIRRYINCSLSYMTGTKLLFHHTDLKALKFCKFKDSWMIFCSDTSGTLGAALNWRPQRKSHDMGNVTSIFPLNCCSSIDFMGKVQRCRMES